MIRILVCLIAVGFLFACSTDALNERTFARPDASSEADRDLVDEDRSPDATDEGDSLDVPTDLGTDNNGFCQPNGDGVIERSEVPLMAGLSGKFATARDVTWDTRPDDVDGDATWDLSQPFDEDETILVHLNDPAGRWYEGTFPNADYVTPLSSESDLLGVYQVTDDEVLLLGIVTPDDGLFATELSYEPGVPVLQLPLTAGDEWSVTSTVTGRYEGVLTAYTETYVFDASVAGDLLTPYGTFPSIRVRSVLERQVGLLTTVIRSFGFVTECFGTIATVASQENEGGAEFTDVAELRRLTP